MLVRSRCARRTRPSRSSPVARTFAFVAGSSRARRGERASEGPPTPASLTSPSISGSPASTRICSSLRVSASMERSSVDICSRMASTSEASSSFCFRSSLFCACRDCFRKKAMLKVPSSSAPMRTVETTARMPFPDTWNERTRSLSCGTSISVQRDCGIDLLGRTGGGTRGPLPVRVPSNAACLVARATKLTGCTAARQEIIGRAVLGLSAAPLHPVQRGTIRSATYLAMQADASQPVAPLCRRTSGPPAATRSARPRAERCNRSRA